MYWIERIHIRTFSSEMFFELRRELQKVESLYKSEGLVEVTVLNCITVAGDLVVVFKWQGKVPEGGKSQLALELTSTLSEFGIFDRTSWEIL